MAVLVDLDLEFLKDVPNEGLKKIVNILVYDPEDGKKRRSESISDTQLFANNYPNNLGDMVNEIIHEIQLFGGESITNKVRGHGVKYREILTDICDKLDIKYLKQDSTPAIEFEFLRRVLFDSIVNYSEEYIDSVLLDLDVEIPEECTLEEKIDKIKELVNNRSTRLEVYHKLITTGSANADGVAGKLMADAIKAGAIGAGFIPIVKQTAGQMLKKFAGSILPGVQILLGLWTARDLLTMWTGPAFRVTTPCAILISVLREEQYQISVSREEQKNVEERINTD